MAPATHLLQLVTTTNEYTAQTHDAANMFATTVTDTVGRQNIAACERVLAELRIPLVSRHCGGEKGRRMRLDSTTGAVTSEIVGADPIEL